MKSKNMEQNLLVGRKVTAPEVVPNALSADTVKGVYATTSGAVVFFPLKRRFVGE
jgi:hypothetical protein